nr:MFS transporter [Kineococcus siccus]
MTDVPLPQLGALVAAAGLVALPLPVLAGRLVDRWGPRPLVVTALALQAVACAGYVVVRGPLGVFTASAVAAVGGRLFWSSVFALVAEHAEAHPVRPVESWFATLNVVRTAGIVVGGLVTGVVVSLGAVGAYVAVAGAAAVCCAVASLLVAVGRPGRGRGGAARPPERARGPAGYGRLLRDRGFLALLVTNSVFATSTLFVGLALPTVVRSGLQGPGWLTAALLVVNALLVAVLGPRGGRVAARRGPLVPLRWAAALWAAAFTALALGAAGTLPTAVLFLAASVLVLSAAEVLHAPASAALVTALAGPDARGRYLAVFQYSFVAAELLGPLLFAGLFDRGAALPFLVLAAANLLALPGLRITGRLVGRAERRPRTSS